MLNGLIGNQGIEINPVLSSWLTVSIPPIPPVFTLNNHVFIVRFSDGTHAALQLENYLSATGTKCCLAINIRFLCDKNGLSHTATFGLSHTSGIGVTQTIFIAQKGPFLSQPIRRR